VDLGISTEKMIHALLAANPGGFNARQAIAALYSLGRRVPPNSIHSVLNRLKTLGRLNTSGPERETVFQPLGAAPPRSAATIALGVQKRSEPHDVLLAALLPKGGSIRVSVEGLSTKALAIVAKRVRSAFIEACTDLDSMVDEGHA
jgi:hypothetical protein